MVGCPPLSCTKGTLSLEGFVFQLYFSFSIRSGSDERTSVVFFCSIITAYNSLEDVTVGRFDSTAVLLSVGLLEPSFISTYNVGRAVDAICIQL